MRTKQLLIAVFLAVVGCGSSAGGKGPDAAMSPVDLASPPDAAPDMTGTVACGSLTCGPGEWCDASGATPLCRCGISGGSCGANQVCCHYPAGCAPAHCNEGCASTCPY